MTLWEEHVPLTADWILISSVDAHLQELPAWVETEQLLLPCCR